MQDPNNVDDKSNPVDNKINEKSDSIKTDISETPNKNEDVLNIDELIHDKKYNIENVPEQPEVIQPKSLGEKLQLGWIKLKKNLKNPRVIALIFFCIILPIGLAVLAVVLGYDAKLFPSSIEGTIYSENTSQPIKTAKITIEERFFTKTTQTEFSSNDEGKFVINNLKYGLVNITVEAEGYETYKGNVQVKRGSNLVTVRLKQLSFANLTFKLISDNPDYDFSKSQIVIAGVKQSVKPDGLISDNNLDIGAISISFSSPDFKDFTKDIVLNPGNNDIGEIDLVAAGDVSGIVTDSISDKPLENVNLKIADVTVKTDQTGKYLFKDLIPEDKVKIESQLTKYLAKNSELNVKQGENTLNMSLVPEGKIVYTSNRLGNSNIYISNYDGTEEKLLSNNTGDSINPSLSSDGKTVFYFTNKDKILTEQYSNIMHIPYKVNIDGSNPVKLYNNPKIPDYTSFFVKSSKMISLKYLPNNTVEIYVADISGANSKLIMTTPPKVYTGNFLVTPNGNTIIFSKNSVENPSINGIYKMNIDGTNEVLILQGDAYPSEVSPDSSKILLTDREEGTYNNNLWVLDINTKNKIQITQGSAPNVGAHFSPNGAFISYASSRDGKSDIYKVPTNGGNEVKITSDANVTSAQWLNTNDYIFFYNKDGLNITTLDSNSKAKVVSKNVVGQTDYNYYGNYFVQ